MSDSAVLLAIRLLLAAVFIVAALGKLTRRQSTADALREFAVRERYVRHGAWALPAVELAVGLLLLAPSTAWVGAIAALALLIVFSLALAHVLVRGDAPNCNCFGALSRGRASWHTVTRNVILGLLATLLVTAGPDVEREWDASVSPHDALIGLGIAFVAALTALAAIVWRLWQRQRWLLVRIDELDMTARRKHVHDPEPRGLKPGSPAPEFDLVGRDNKRVTLDCLLGSGRRQLLVFLESHCAACKDLAPTLRSWQIEVGSTAEIVAVTDDAQQPLEVPGLQHVLRQQANEVSDAYGVDGTPAAVVVNPDGRIGSPIAAGQPEIRRLVERLADGIAHAPSPDHPLTRRPGAIGTPLAEFALPDLDGQIRTRSWLAGSETLLLFWNSDCGFCQELLGDLRACDAKVSAAITTRRLVVVSSGSAARNADLALSAPVLLDDTFTLAESVGATGTPSAVILDANGIISSTLAIGAPTVRAFLQTPTRLLPNQPTSENPETPLSPRLEVHHIG